MLGDAGFEPLLAHPLRLEKTLVVSLIVLGKQAEMPADDDRSWLREGFDGIDRGGPRLDGFLGRDRDKGNRGRVGARTSGAQSLNLLRIAGSPTGIVHLNSPLDLRRQRAEGGGQQCRGQLSSEHRVGRLRNQKARQAHITLSRFYLRPG